MLRLARQTATFLHVILMLTAFLLVASIALIFVREKWRRTKVGTLLMTRWCRYALWLLRIKVNLVNFEGTRPALYVSNHLSYSDVLAIASYVPTCFVTSVEIRETPVLGQICQLAGCLFVERRNKLNILQEIGELTEGLRRGFNVTIFPEATSTNGEKVLRFKRPLFTAAIEAGVPVIPFCINYRRAGGEPVSLKNRDSICWYGDMDFVSHLWRLIGLFGVEVDLVFSKELISRAFTEVGDLSQAAQASVEQHFRPIADPNPSNSLTS